MFDLPLNNERFALWNLRPAVDDSNASATCRCRRFDDPLCILLTIFMPRLSQHVEIRWNDEGSWHEPELFLSVSRHQRLQVAPASILSSDLKASWQVIKLLVRMKCLKAWRLHVLPPRSHPVVWL